MCIRDRPQAFKDSLLITYVNRGQVSMERAYQEQYKNNNLPYEPMPGLTSSAGMNHLLNAKEIASTINLTDYADIQGHSTFADLAIRQDDVGLAAVSYTHLDVYKRQVYSSLDYYPKNWLDFRDCIYRYIEPQWFISLCSSI